MKKIKYTHNRNYRDFGTEEIIEETIIKRRPILLNKNKGIFQRIKEKIAFWFKV